MATKQTTLMPLQRQPCNAAEAKPGLADTMVTTATTTPWQQQLPPPHHSNHNNDVMATIMTMLQ